MILDKFLVSIIISTCTLIVGIAGLWLNVFQDSRKEKARAKSEIQKAISELTYISTEEEFAIALNNLRKKMASNAHLIKNKKLSNFYDRWLSDPKVKDEMPISNLYSSFETDHLIFELLEIKL